MTVSTEEARAAKAELQKKLDDLCTCTNAWKKRGVLTTLNVKVEDGKLSGTIAVSVEIE